MTLTKSTHFHSRQRTREVMTSAPDGAQHEGKNRVVDPCCGGGASTIPKAVRAAAAGLMPAGIARDSVRLRKPGHVAARVYLASARKNAGIPMVSESM